MSKAALLCLALILLCAALPGPVESQAVASITVSGTVTGPGGPVAGVAVYIGSDVDEREAWTNAAGFYSTSLQTTGYVRFGVCPDPSLRLAWLNYSLANVTADLMEDIVLEQGHLFDLGVTAGGALLLEPGPLELLAMAEQRFENQWHFLDWAGSRHRYSAVLPPDIYWVTYHAAPPGYFPTSQGFDLRGGDLVADMPLNDQYRHPIPYDPPIAAKIQFGAIDGLGEAAVTGGPGAALPLSHVLLVNLKSGHQAHTVAEADGSFAARIYAPPGSAVMVKHGPGSHRWNDLAVGLAEGLNPYPGTIINLAHTHSGQGLQIPFAAVGSVDYVADDARQTRNYVGAAWALEGVLEPVVVDGEWTQVLDGNYEGAPVPGLYFGGFNWTHPALADLDGDGDADLLIGDETGSLALYRNDDVAAAPAQGPEWVRVPGKVAGVELDGWAYPALADLDGDQDVDLVVGAADGNIYVYFNSGSPQVAAWPVTPDVTLSAGAPAAPALEDLNGDGLLDLVSGHGGGSLDYFQNTGTASAPAWTHQTGAYGGVNEGEALQPASVDLDGDSDLDLLVGLCGRVLWYRRGGPATAPTWTRVNADPIGYGGGSCANSPGAGDWSRDGVPDLVVGEHWGQPRFFRNDGAPAWTEQLFPIPFENGGDTAPALADWDGDGDLDMLLGQVWGSVQAYRNDGSAAEPDWHSEGEVLRLPWTNHPHAFPALADIDGDGDHDLFVGEGGWQGAGAGGNIHYYENRGTPRGPDWVFVTDRWLGLDVGGWSRPAFVDIDDDGDLDLFVGAEDGTLAYVENVGTATGPAWAAPVQPYAGLQMGSYAAPAFYDVDGSGRLDMLVGQENGSLAYVRSTGSPTSPDWELVATTYPAIDVGHMSSPATADLDGDGQAELVLGTGYGGLQLYEYQGPGAPGAWDGFAPGDPFQVEATLTLYGPAIDGHTDVGSIELHSAMDLQKLFDDQGHPQPARSYFLSSLLTPSGFPIQGSSGHGVPLPGSMHLSGLHPAGDHALEGSVQASGEIPPGLPPGIYRPVFRLHFEGVPTNEDWLAASVTFHTYELDQAPLPPIRIQAPAQATASRTGNPRLIWRLLMDDMVQGTRGTGAREDIGLMEVASQIVTQGAAFSIAPVDERTGQAITYRLEPFLPAISFTDRRMPTPPLLPLDLPGGEICVSVTEPDGSQRDLGCETPAQSFNRTRTTRLGTDLNSGTVQMEDVYSLKAASDRFRATFDQFGHHVVQMTGEVADIWGNVYEGGGTYDLWVAHPLDIDPGVLPGAPLAVGDRFNPSLQFYPRVPAEVELTLTLYPESDPARAVVQTFSGRANRFGTFGPGAAAPLAAPGEYRVDLQAIYTAADGTMYHGAMTWGGVVMTPRGQADLAAHGRRGLDSLEYIPNHWFVSSRDLTIPPGSVSHSLNPYYNGDIFWSRMSDGPWGGDSLILGASVHDPIGSVQAAIESRRLRSAGEISGPGSFEDRVGAGELPLFISTHSGRPAEIEPGDVDQIAYSYRSSQRPGVRVRELVAEDGESGGYWRLDTLYDDQLGVGVLGDQPNDFKFQYVGVVYRDLDTGHSEYLGQGSGWVFIPDDDPAGSRVMPPFAGTGNGGWTTEGGPLLTLKGEEIDMFILPTGVRPGAVLEVGDTFRFAGHLMPTLDSQVEAVVTAPGGGQHTVSGQANSTGYFYDGGDDFTVTEPGLWSVDVRVWHDGQCSGGATVPPYPSGDVLGSDGGRYWFYVVPAGSPRLAVSTPSPGLLPVRGELAPFPIRGSWPEALTGAQVAYTVSMPGYILDQGQATVKGNSFEFSFDPQALQQDFPNLDLMSRDGHGGPGLADTIAIGILLQGRHGGQEVYRATTITIQGEQVHVQEGETAAEIKIHLPLVLKGG